jgi:hypothetical protein
MYLFEFVTYLHVHPLSLRWEHLIIHDFHDLSYVFHT